MLVSRALEDWLDYFKNLHPRSIELGLNRIIKVARILDLIDWHCPVITVSGTNGKGSCVALLQVILTEAGYRVGCYTSPHLLDYTERITILEQSVTETDLCFAFSHLEAARLTVGVSLTYFEWSTLAALWLFKRANLDAVILEVGLGGRLDAVNCVDPDIALISTVALDHQVWLGSTREHIAYEKAGIMRAGRPCVCGDFDTPKAIQTQAEALSLPLYQQGYDFGFQHDAAIGSGATWTWWNREHQWACLPVPRLALQNASSVLQVVYLLKDRFHFSRKAIERGLVRSFLPGRFQIIQGSVLTILDVAHNPAAGSWLAEQLRVFSRSGRLLAVAGMLKDKDIYYTLSPLVGLVDAWYLGTLNVDRGAQSECLSEHVQQAWHNREQVKLSKTSLEDKITAHLDYPWVCQSYSSVALAYENACREAQPGDIILVTGSFYTVAEVIRYDTIISF